jgi:hypothetical protein
VISWYTSHIRPPNHHTSIEKHAICMME